MKEEVTRDSIGSTIRKQMPKNYKDLLGKELEAYITNFTNNLLNIYCTQGIDGVSRKVEEVCKRPTFKSFIFGSFTWSVTMEGHIFWSNISQRTGRTQKPVEETYNITRAMLGKIYDVACSEWKDKILLLEHIYGVKLSDSVVLPEEVVEEMFKASSKYQRDILSEVFPTHCEKVNRNAIVKTLVTDTTETERGLRNLSNELFEDHRMLQIGHNAAQMLGRKDLDGRSLYLRPELELIVHQVPGPMEGTLLEFKKK